MTVRSYLFVPGSDRAMLSKAWTRGADALVVDLEDGVAPAGKEEARAVVTAWLHDQHGPPGQIWIRANNDDALFAEDLAAANHAVVTGVFVPKVADGTDAHRRAEALRAAAVDRKPLGYVPMIETARAMLEIDAIAAAAGVTTLLLGEYDFAAELGIRPTDTGAEMLMYRSRLVLACAAAGIAPPIAPVHADFIALDPYRRASEAFKAMGYLGRAAIHPAQVAVDNEVFSVTLVEIQAARRLLDLHESALASGKGVSIDDNGKMIDEAVVRAARQTIQLGNLDNE